MGDHKKNELQRNSVSFAGAVALSAAFMGPAVSVFYDIVPAAGVAGIAFPLAFVFSMVAILFVCSSVIAFSRKLQSASFAFTYSSAGLGPKFGFITGWIALLAYAMAAPLNYCGFGIILSEFLQRQYGIQASWVWFFLAAALAGSLLSCFGVSHSTRVTLVFLVLEVTVMTALFGTVIFGGAQNSIQPFLYHNAPHGLSSLGAGMVFGILSFTGFEAAANLGEEAQDAKRTIPRAITFSVVLIGLFFIAGAYVADIAFHLNAAELANNGAPYDAIGRRFWGNRWAWLLDLTVLNSVFANAIAGQVSMVRNLFALGRARVLPKLLGQTHSSGVPFRAIGADLTLCLLVGLCSGRWLGAWGAFKLMATIMSIGLILVYGLVSAALPFYFLREHRAEFSRWRHLLTPAICIILLLPPLYGTIWPAPTFPYSLAPYIVMAWIAAGVCRLGSGPPGSYFTTREEQSR